MAEFTALSGNTTPLFFLFYKDQTSDKEHTLVLRKSKHLEYFLQLCLDIVCWIPFIIILILQFGFQVSIPHYAKPIYPLFSAISSWINPIIYGFMNRSMRKEFRNTLLCKKD